MKKYICTILLLVSGLLFTSCGDNEILKSVDFSVSTEKTTYSAGESVTFEIANAPNWLTFYSGEDGKKYPDTYGIGIKGITEDLSVYSYIYDQPGTYEVVFLGGNTNYKGSNEEIVKIALTIN